MSIIYKYILADGENTLALPSDSVPLSVGEQNNEVVMWVMHLRDPETVRVYVRLFHVVSTGAELDIGYTTFIGTVQKDNGYVKHVFEQMDVS